MKPQILNKEKLTAVLERWKGHPSITGLMEKFGKMQSRNQGKNKMSDVPIKSGFPT